MSSQDETLTPRQLAAELHLSVSYLAKLRIRGGGPKFERYGHRTVRYPRTEVNAWRAARSATSTSAEQAA
ncbi:helix-turn-helix transcriptional regulator [Brevundimonas sp.]|uniref:helix-turn-helix transcriptional regulator n=1 Tax=Brevundimonas sp. TaxID=1871086 RepID=UPI0035AFEE8A